MSSIKDFKDQNGYVLAHAAIPDGYQIGGSLVNGFQHESVPFFVQPGNKSDHIRPD